MKKLIKRGFAALLALTLALGMSVSAFAADGTAVAKKDYQLTNSDTKSESPEETFTFTAEAANVTDANNPNGSAVTTDQMPNLTITVDKYNKGEAGSANSKKALHVTKDKDFPERGHL